MRPDLRIEARCRNNVLWHAIYDVYPSVAEFCRAHGLNQQQVGELLNLTLNPYRVPHWRDVWAEDDMRRKDLRPTAEQLCAVTGLGKDELFPAALYSGAIPSRRVAEISSAQMPRPITAGVHPLLPPVAEQAMLDQERQAMLDAVLKTLTPREEKVMRMRFGLDDGEEQALADVGQSFGVSQERIRQIEARALRKLRHPSRSRKLAHLIDVEPVPDEL